ncbi:MAG: hypothetical protein AAB341_04295, partial [Planctomycetota bacterium]
MPPTLWVEWRFRSNNPRSPFFYSCDARFSNQYHNIEDVVFITGDAIVSDSGDFFLVDLDLNEFRTYRFESVDGSSFRISVDGLVFYVYTDTVGDVGRTLQFGGNGGCTLMSEATRNEWDFIRYQPVVKCRFGVVRRHHAA